MARDVRATSEDVVVTAGAQQALDLLIRAVLRPARQRLAVYFVHYVGTGTANSRP